MHHEIQAQINAPTHTCTHSNTQTDGVRCAKWSVVSIRDKGKIEATQLQFGGMPHIHTYTYIHAQKHT